MTSTPVSLLDRLKRAGPDAVEWERVQQMYVPLVRRWLQDVPGLEDEIEDLSQEVFVVLLRELPSFERRREGSFRAWLRRVTVNRLRTQRKQRRRRPTTDGRADDEAVLSQLEDPHSRLSQAWDREHDRHVFRQLLAAIAPEFNAVDQAAFRRFAVDGLSAAATALELGISENSVLLAKSKILKRLRLEAAGLID